MFAWVFTPEAILPLRKLREESMATYVLWSAALAIQNSTLFFNSMRIAGVMSECARGC